MALKDISVKTPKAKAGKSEMPVVEINAMTTVTDAEGVAKQVPLITEFNKAKLAMKDAEAKVKEMEPEVKKLGVLEWIKANVDKGPGEPLSSVKLIDPNGSELRLTGQDRYPLADAEPVDVLFTETLHEDINQYVQFTLKAAFNSKVFLDADGDFQEEIYEQFNQACAAVAKKLGVANPLSATKVLQPKPQFHKERWVNFNVVQNRQLFDVLPNVVTMTPLVTNDKPAVKAESAA